MEFEDAKERIEGMRAKLAVEKDGWRQLLEEVLEGAAAGNKRLTAALSDQQDNAARAQAVLVRLVELREVAAGTDTVHLDVVAPVQVWVEQFREQVVSLKGKLGDNVPSFSMPTESIDEATDELKQQLDETSEALVVAVGVSLIDARDHIRATLAESGELLQAALENLFTDVHASVESAIESLGELWRETGESIVAGKDAVLTAGEATEASLKAATNDALDDVMGNLASLATRVEELLEALRDTMSTLERTLEVVGELSDATSVGMSGASKALGVVREIMHSVT